MRIFSSLLLLLFLVGMPLPFVAGPLQDKVDKLEGKVYELERERTAAQTLQRVTEKELNYAEKEKSSIIARMDNQLSQINTIGLVAAIILAILGFIGYQTMQSWVFAEIEKHGLEAKENATKMLKEVHNAKEDALQKIDEHFQTTDTKLQNAENRAVETSDQFEKLSEQVGDLSKRNYLSEQEQAEEDKALKLVVEEGKKNGIENALEVAERATTAGQYDVAIKELLRGLEFDPKHFYLNYTLCEAYLRQYYTNYQYALLASANDAVNKVNTDHAAVYFLKGRILFELGLFYEALHNLNKGLSNTSFTFAINNQKASIFTRVQNMAMTKNICLANQKLKPKDTSNNGVIAHLHIMNDELPEAKIILESFSEQEKNDSYICSIYALYFVLQKNFKEAESYALKSIPARQATDERFDLLEVYLIFNKLDLADQELQKIPPTGENLNVTFNYNFFKSIILFLTSNDLSKSTQILKDTFVEQKTYFRWVTYTLTNWANDQENDLTDNQKKGVKELIKIPLDHNQRLRDEDRIRTDAIHGEGTWAALCLAEPDPADDVVLAGEEE